jgi:uncharacterized protein YyaL (SSP411 family)
MWRGGIYDHLRGGFARYSVDREWLVPHFEKMLYDNAQLLGLYAEASRVWPEHGSLREVVRDTIAYLVADMRDPGGAFYAATDADSEGVEGKFFCWTPTQLLTVLGDKTAADLVARVYGVTPAGNFEHGMSILHLPKDYPERAAELGTSAAELRAELAPLREHLLAHRYTRVPPLRDEKLLTAWNALLVSGLVRASEAATTWGEPERAREWLALAEATGRYLCTHHITADGRVLRAAFAGQATHPRLPRGPRRPRPRLPRPARGHPRAPVAGHRRPPRAATPSPTTPPPGGAGFYMTADDAEQLLERRRVPARLRAAVRPRHDPRGPAAPRSQRGRPGRRARGRRGVMHRYRGAVAQPFAYASLLTAARFAAPNAVHVTLLAESPEAAAELARPVRAARAQLAAPLSLHFAPADGPARAIVCRARTCSAPFTDPAALAPALHADDSIRYTDR